MKNPSEPPEKGDALRERLIGLGEHSLRKSYYPELQQRLEELERFKAFLDYSNDAIFLVEVPTGRIIDFNEAATRQMGWSHEELLELSIFDVSELGSNSQGKGLVCSREEIAERRALIETNLYRRGGDRIPAEMTLARMLFQEAVYVIAVARDIAKRKQAEEALAERARLAELGCEVGAALTAGGSLESTLQKCATSLVRHTEAAFGRIWIVSNEDPELLVLKASAGLYTRIDGRHSRKRIGREKVGVIAQERKPYLTNAVIGDPMITDQDWARREGMEAFAGYPLLVEDRLVGVVGLFFRNTMTEAVLTTISSVADEIAVGTQRLRAEDSLRKSEKQYHTLAEVSPVGIFYTGPGGQLLYVNERWCEITGQSRKDLSRKGLGSFLLDQEAVIGKWREAASTDSPFKYEYSIRRPDGGEAWVFTQVMAEKDDLGEILGFVGTITDITERKKAEKALRKSEESRIKLEAELAFAAEVQTKLLPQVSPSIPGFEIATLCKPAYHVAGDFYDWLEMVPGLLSLTLGDVMGKGMAAAMLMATVRSTLRAVAQQNTPAEALRLAERALRQDLTSSDSFVTLFHAHLKVAARRMTYVDCGHGLVFLRRLDGRVEELHPRGLPLGVFSSEVYHEGNLVFEEGDALVLYSDGLTDAVPELNLDNRYLAGRLEGTASAREMVDRLASLVPKDVPLPDDMTILILLCQQI